MTNRRSFLLSLKKRLAGLLLRFETGAQVVHSKQLWPYLTEIGWFRSRASARPLGVGGEPLPWLTYPAIWFLEKRLSREMHVFEYGSGASTFWWSERVSRVVSCEHDRSWFERLRNELPEQVEYLFHELDADVPYRDSILRFEAEFHIVVVDGRDRVACARNATTVLRDDGVLIWDDAHRAKYQEGCTDLQTRGFKRLDFEGLSPLSARRGCTSIFYRDSNCLGL